MLKYATSPFFRRRSPRRSAACAQDRAPDPSPGDPQASSRASAWKRRSRSADSRHPAAAGTYAEPTVRARGKTRIALSTAEGTESVYREGAESVNRPQAFPTAPGGPVAGSAPLRQASPHSSPPQMLLRRSRTPCRVRRDTRPRRLRKRQGAAALEYEPELLFRGLVPVRRFRPATRAVRELSTHSCSCVLHHAQTAGRLAGYRPAGQSALTFHTTPAATIGHPLSTPKALGGHPAVRFPHPCRGASVAPDTPGIAPGILEALSGDPGGCHSDNRFAGYKGLDRWPTGSGRACLTIRLGEVLSRNRS